MEEVKDEGPIQEKWRIPKSTKIVEYDLIQAECCLGGEYRNLDGVVEVSS